MPYKVLSHTADTGIEATAPSISALIDELATGMFELMTTVAPGAHVGVEVEVKARPPANATLLKDLLRSTAHGSEA